MRGVHVRLLITSLVWELAQGQAGVLLPHQLVLEATNPPVRQGMIVMAVPAHGQQRVTAPHTMITLALALEHRDVLGVVGGTIAHSQMEPIKELARVMLVALGMRGTTLVLVPALVTMMLARVPTTQALAQAHMDRLVTVR